MYVQCSILTRGNCPQKTWHLLYEAVQYALDSGINCGMSLSQAPHCVDIGRNAVVDEFLSHQAGFTHLLQLDDDTLIPREAIVKLAEADKDIISACVPGMRAKVVQTPTGPETVRGLFLAVASPEGDGRWLHDYFEGVIETPRVGGACTLIRREVFEAMDYPWYVYHTPERGQPVAISEDVDFCIKAAKAGFKLHAHGDVRCGHVKEIDLAVLLQQINRNQRAGSA